LVAGVEGDYLYCLLVEVEEVWLYCLAEGVEGVYLHCLAEGVEGVVVMACHLQPPSLEHMYKLHPHLVFHHRELPLGPCLGMLPRAAGPDPLQCSAHTR